MEKFVDTQGCRVMYEYLHGSKDTAVVLLHGYGLNRNMWQAQAKMLSENGYSVINMDVRGHGRSRPTAAFSVSLAADDVHKIITTEGIKKFVLCGLSMGGFVAQEYALRYGGACGYMLTGVTPLCIPYKRWEKVLLRRSGSMMRYFYTWKRLQAAMAAGCCTTSAARKAVADMFAEMNKDEFLLSWHGFCTCLHEADLRFDAPLLVVVGKHDTRGTIQAHLKDWKRYYPDCCVMEIADAGHAANLDQADKYNAVLAGFVEKCAMCSTAK